MRIAIYQGTSQSSLPPETYIYNVKQNSSTSAYLAAIASDDSLHIIDPIKLQDLISFPNVHRGVTTLRTVPDQPHVLLTAGRDGAVRSWDVRSGEKTEVIEDSNSPVLSLDCISNQLAMGSELVNAQASITIRDMRYPSRQLVQYIESHNDDVTELQYHPTHSAYLLSGSTDGLINLFDTNFSDEEDALLQITNHGSSIHHAGFLDASTFYGLSHDETFSIYPISTDNDSDTREAIAHGDMRPILDCGYIVDVVRQGDVNVLAAGSHSDQHLDILPLPTGTDWTSAKESGLRLPGAHGEEIVRSFCVNNQISTIFTAGEDGKIKAWRMPAESVAERVGPEKAATPPKQGKTKRSKDVREAKERWEPY